MKRGWHHLLWAGIAISFLLLGIMVGRQLPPQQASDNDPSLPGIKVKCLDVVDGDTTSVEFDGKEERVRILGIDCPETRRGKKLEHQAKLYGMAPDEVKGIGRMAKLRSAQYASQGVVRLVFADDVTDRDSFGRLLCYVEAWKGWDFGEKLLEAGLADMAGGSHPRQERYSRAAEQAKTKRYGIWANCGNK